MIPRMHQSNFTTILYPVEGEGSSKFQIAREEFSLRSDNPMHESRKAAIGQCVPKAVGHDWPRSPATRYLAFFLNVISCPGPVARAKKEKKKKTRKKKKTERTDRRNTREQPNEFLSVFIVLYDVAERRAMQMDGDERTKGKRELHRYKFEQEFFLQFNNVEKQHFSTKDNRWSIRTWIILRV